MSYLEPESEERKGRDWLLYGALAIILLILAIGAVHYWNLKMPWESSRVAQVEQKGIAPSLPIRLPERIVIVKDDDTLIGLFGKDWTQVCRHNRLKNCNSLEVGQKLKLPSGVTVKATPVVSAVKPVPVKKAVKASASQSAPITRQVHQGTPPPAKAMSTAPKKPQGLVTRFKEHVRTLVRRASGRDADGNWRWLNVGGAPQNKCPNKERCDEEAMNGLGLTESDKEEMRQLMRDGKYEAVSVEVGAKYEYVAFYQGGKVRFKTQVVLADPDTPVTAKRYRLSSGRVVDIIDQCGNWAVSREIKILLPPPPDEPPPSLPPTPPDEPPPPVVEEHEADRWCERVSYNGTVGFETQVRKKGHGTDVVYITLGAYCQHKIKNGWFGFGPNINASAYRGTTRNRDGKYSGEDGYLQLAAKWDLDSGESLTLKAGPGFMRGRYSDRFGNRSKKSYTMLGGGFEYDRYPNEAHPDRKRFNAWGHIGVPISGHASDGNEHQVGGYIGARQHLSKPDKPISFYVQGNLNYEVNSGQDFGQLGLRIGVSDRNDHIGCGVGPDINLLEGGTMLGAGCHVSVNGIIRDKRTKDRASGIENDEGEVLSAPVANDSSSPRRLPGEPKGLQ